MSITRGQHDGGLKITELPEPTLITIFQSLGVIDVLKLRRVNRHFYQFSHLLIIWIQLYQRSTLILPKAPYEASVKYLETSLVLATQLDLRLTSPNPVCRTHWTLAVDNSPITCLTGKYLVLGDRRGGRHFSCINLEDHSTQYLRSHFARPFCLISVSETVIHGLFGLTIADRSAGRQSRDCSVYFQPMGLDLTSPEPPSPQVITLTMPNGISRLRLFGHLALIGTAVGEVCLFDLSSHIRRDFRVNGPIEDLGIYDLYLVVHTASKIQTFALEDERDLPDLTVHIPSFDMFLHPLLPPSAAPHPLTGHPVINIVYHSDETLQEVVFGSTIPEIGQEGLRVGTRRTLAADDSDDSHCGSLCLTRAGHRHALSLVSCWSGERKIFLSEVQATHGRQVIHKELKLPHVDWDVYQDMKIHWDEVSGRVCIGGLRGSKIMVIEL